MRPNHRDVQSQQKICFIFCVFPGCESKVSDGSSGTWAIFRDQVPVFFFRVFSESLLNPGLLVQRLFGSHRIIADSYLHVREHVYLIFIVGEIP